MRRSLEVRSQQSVGENCIIRGGVLPILLLEGTGRKIVSPMAINSAFALGGSMTFVAVLLPAMASIFCPQENEEEDVFVVRIVKVLLRAPMSPTSIKRRLVTVAMAWCWFFAGLRDCRI